MQTPSNALEQVSLSCALFCLLLFILSYCVSCVPHWYPMSLVGSLRGVQANPEPCNSNSKTQ
jgi:hypothetical protein